jgi:uncharacterized protein with PIN domain
MQRNRAQVPAIAGCGHELSEPVAERLVVLPPTTTKRESSMTPTKIECPKCKLPMSPHSSEEIVADGRPETMDIFNCVRCGQLSARPQASQAA